MKCLSPSARWEAPTLFATPFRLSLSPGQSKRIAIKRWTACG